MNLPSPNVAAEESDPPLFRREGEASDSEDAGEELGPPASALTRRRALVPPKLLTDSPNYDQHEHDVTTTVNGCNDSNLARNKRRSSIVVIPPMQICPGDLLVYSKVLTQRTNLLAGDLDGSTQSLAVTDTDPVGSRKGKNTWSLLRLFDRSSRAKSESLSGLEEVLSCLQPSEFEDEQLSRFKGMCWNDFVSYMEGGQQGDDESSISTESQDTPLLRDTPSHSSFAVHNNRSPFITPSKGDSRADAAAEKLDRLSALSCLDPETPLPRKRHPMTIMRTMSERSLDRGRTSQLLNLLSERAQARAATKLASACSKPTPPPPPPPAPLPSLERTLEAARDNARVSLNKNETKRREAVWDLFQSECAFLYDHLMVLKNVYMEPLKKIQVDGYAMFAEPELLFGNLDELCCVTYAFCKEFINLLEQHQEPGGRLDTTNVLVKLFQKGSKATMLCQAYHRYALNYINALNYLETLRRQLEFCEFEKWCNRDPRCKKLQLTDLLVAPVQHIMKVPLILRDIEGRTEEPQEKAVVREIIEAEEHSLRELDDKMKWLKNFERLLEIQRNIVWPPVTELDPKVFIPEFLKGAISKQPCERLIVSPRRQIILEGSLHLMDNNKPQEMYVILFDDMLLITRRKKGLHKKKSSLTENWPTSCSRASTTGESALRYIVYKQPLSLDRFFIHDVSPHESAASKLEAAFVLVNLNRFQQIVAVYTFQAQTEQIKQTWLLKLRDAQDKWKRTLQNTVFRTQRLPSSAASPPKGTQVLREASIHREYP
ncbi:pleckstrin homology domain-containing family G member 7 [Penaeus vannamei]|uniref:pleckstrin homology domain-containing family G member 7 n=1 Tax=Penaeus vannamei TaxID=6689 RepID=UPI00387F68D6